MVQLASRIERAPGRPRNDAAVRRPAPTGKRVAARLRETPDEALVRFLFEEHGRAMLAYATQLTRNRATAEDVVQEAMIRAWRHAEDLVDERGSIRGWLLTVVRNIITDQVRARLIRAQEVVEGPAEVAVDNDHAQRVVDRIVVADKLSRLSPEHRVVIEHVYLQGYSVADTAQLLDIPAGTVKSRTFYALRTMREMFADRPRRRLALSAGTC